MHYLSSLNRNKILSVNGWGLVLALFLLLAFYNLDTLKTGYLNQVRLEVTDGTEYRYLYQPGVLDGDKINGIIEKYRELSLPEDRNRVAVADLPALDMIVQVYGWDWSGLREVSEAEFYQDRCNVIGGAGEQVKTACLSQSVQPIQTGYAEGWKNVNAGMGQCVLFVLILLSIVLAPLFNEDKTLGVDNLIRSTKFGTTKLSRLRIINAFQLSSLLYLAAVSIYIVPILMLYSGQGGDLPIQSNPQLFLSTANVSFLQQFLLYLVMGYAVVVLITGVALWVSASVRQVYTGYAVMLFILAVIYAIQTMDINFLK